ncbi:hypothetical protein [Kitasatospora sp. MBT63]|uniref:hypothetical protein n=1 Tax=Kitasatospora sp. MBT63 TaxID=1444768 RepID=UPI000539B2E6|nr:hypothetical protein [Kitasatospora sp. MBT63]
MNKHSIRRIGVGVAAAVALATAVAAPAQAFVPGPIGVVYAGPEFQLSINTDGGNPAHTTRHADGTWAAWDSVPDMYYNPGATSSLTQAESGTGKTFLAAEGSAIQFLIRDSATGQWTSPSGTAAPIPDEVPIEHSGNTPATARITKLVGSVVMGGEFHLFGQRGPSALYEVVRHSDGTWGAWQELYVPGQIGEIKELSVASTDGAGIQLVAVAGGRLWHANRADAGSAFAAWGDVFANSSNPGTAEHVAVAAVKGELQVVVTGNNGTGIYHAIRRATGSWTVFGDVKAATKASLGTIAGVGVADTDRLSGNDALQVVVVDTAGHLRHTVRNSAGSWTTFGDVDAVIPNSHLGTAVSVAGAGQ